MNEDHQGALYQQFTASIAEDLAQHQAHMEMLSETFNNACTPARVLYEQQIQPYYEESVAKLEPVRKNLEKALTKIRDTAFAATNKKISAYSKTEKQIQAAFNNLTKAEKAEYMEATAEFKKEYDDACAQAAKDFDVLTAPRHEAYLTKAAELENEVMEKHYNITTDVIEDVIPEEK